MTLKKATADEVTVRALCVQFGIEYPHGSPDSDCRKEILQHFARDIPSLERLAETGNMSLYSLALNDLLPARIAHRVLHVFPSAAANCDENDVYVHKDIAELTDLDRLRFSRTRLVGEKAASLLTALIELHQETCGFKAMLEMNADDLSAADKLSLINRIIDAIHDDPKTRRKLLAMFPAPSRTIPTAPLRTERREP